MNHYAARQREKDHRWDYTIANDGRAYAVGYCAGWREYDKATLAARIGEAAAATLRRNQEEMRAYQAKFHTGGHATAEEACECYRQYLLDTSLLLDGGETDGAYVCRAEGCEERTTRTARIAGRMQSWHLCDEHRTRDVVDGLLFVSEAWSS